MPGVAPKPDAIRRNARVGPVQLPAEGRKGVPPPWPFEGYPNEAEGRIWTRLWHLPQAVMWEKQNDLYTIARYCRLLATVEAEAAPSAALHAQVTALEDRIGMNPKAMRLLMWQVADDEVAQKRTEPGSSDVRGRIKAVG